VPEEDLRVVILTNAEEDNAFESVLYHVLDAYLSGPTLDYISLFKALGDKERKVAEETMRKAGQARAADAKPSLAFEEYAGDYSDPWYGKVTLRKENAGLLLNFERTEKRLADLEHWQYDTFKAHWRDRGVEDAFLTFALKPDGTVDHFTMVAVSPLADFSFDYQDLYFTPVRPQKGENRKWKLDSSEIPGGRIGGPLQKGEACQLTKEKGPAHSQKLLFQIFDGGGTGEEAGGGAAFDEFADGFLAFFAIAKSPLVDVHADKLVGKFRVHVAGELHGVVQGFVAMPKAISHTVANRTGNQPSGIRAK